MQVGDGDEPVQLPVGATWRSFSFPAALYISLANVFSVCY